ncbi:anti-sigma factor family protein [Sutcliffiella cohnii]|uniref:Zinc-finger domain-containing protein n=1 Tax=Sutcliffiella cohnii TaxID=33932 RepID=A0A223KSQ8_9BACI|nr:MULTISPECIES: hypothetical protein [Sutcliffiella]AST92353.1 hypothetical protein BC6307_14170 [Sutcliffiella cohnii]MED4017184.1 hypothetical protein [Sutcliffiella cohnii]WBL13584.1 hypothetical protein O1A01_16890 [Sutcliffiella sp. NC1]
MNHYTQEEWLAYIQDELSEDRRTILEDHLYSCDQCLHVYLEQLNYVSDTLPMLSEEEQNVVPIETKKMPFYQHSIFHYTVAAAITFLLLTSGMFHSMIGFASNIEESTVQNREEAVSKNVMNKALSFLELIERKHKEEK